MFYDFFFLILDNLEAAPGGPVPEFKVKSLKKVKFSYEHIFLAEKNIKIIFHIIDANKRQTLIYLEAAGV